MYILCSLHPNRVSMYWPVIDDDDGVYVCVCVDVDVCELVPMYILKFSFL